MEYNKNDLNIFICSHKDFENPVKSKCYRVVDVRTNKIKKINGLDDKFYSELLSFYNVNKYEDLPNYVGFCHYRRYFSFMDNIPDIDKIFKDFNVIVAYPLKLIYTVREHYKIFHNIEDLEIVENIIKEKHPEYYKTCEKFLNGRIMIPYNMFIMRKEDFQEYIKFMSDVLNEYIKIVGTDINKRIEDNKDKYLKSFYPNSTIDYQYRIGGYLAERLTNVFILKRFKSIMTCPVIITENKYGLKRNTI